MAGISGLQKLHVLQLHTAGAAKEIVDNYSFLVPESAADEAYKLIWNALAERFGDNGQTTAILVERVEGFDRVDSPEDWNGIGKLKMLCHAILNSLRYSNDRCRIGLDRYYHGMGLNELVSKLPGELRKQWRTTGQVICDQRSVSGMWAEGTPILHLEDFYNFLSKVYSMRRNPLFSGLELDDPGTTPDEAIASRGLRTGTMVDDSDHKVTDIHTCVLHPEARDGHKISECNGFTKLTPVQKREFLWNNGLCFRCTGKHDAKSCPSKVECEYCSKNHVTALHGLPWVTLPTGRNSIDTEEFENTHSENS